MSEKRKKLIVTRYNPESDTAPRTQVYEVPYEDDTRVLDALNYIKDVEDGTLTYRSSCQMGVCGSCGMNVNGEPKLTCKTRLSDYGDTVTVEPLSNFPVIRDLVVEMDGFMEKFQDVKPWVVRAKEMAVEEGASRQSAEELSHFKQFSMCINCMLCYAACPVVGKEPSFLGPAAIAMAHRYNLDTRDEGQPERMEALREGEVYSCSYAGECSEVCPKNVDPAAAVQQSKLFSTIDWVTGLVLPSPGSDAKEGE